MSERRLQISLTLAALSSLGLFYYLSYTRRKRQPVEIFTEIYEKDQWNPSSADWPFYSGPGSHDAYVVEPYVSAVRTFIADTFAETPDVVDLGCGDFNVGRQIRSVTNSYVACDVFPDLIEHNRAVFEDVDFRVLDMTTEELPAGDIVFIRQVLQHLSNEHISQILPKLYQYRWLVLTESIPRHDHFTPNITHETGPHMRLRRGSGVDLTAPPFNLVVLSETVLCEVFTLKERIRTIVYQLQE